jgi:hypothetical protein
VQEEGLRPDFFSVSFCYGNLVLKFSKNSIPNGWGTPEAEGFIYSKLNN